MSTSVQGSCSCVFSLHVVGVIHIRLVVFVIVLRTTPPPPARCTACLWETPIHPLHCLRANCEASALINTLVLSCIKRCMYVGAMKKNCFWTVVKNMVGSLLQSFFRFLRPVPYLHLHHRDICNGKWNKSEKCIVVLSSRFYLTGKTSNCCYFLLQFVFCAVFQEIKVETIVLFWPKVLRAFFRLVWNLNFLGRARL